MVEKKTTKSVGLSATVSIKDNTVAGISEAAKYVGAPDSATVSITNVGTPYTPPNADGTPSEPVEDLRFSVTFAWSEDK
jgi:hypothetical protein